MYSITHRRMIQHMPTYERTNSLINEIFKSTAIELDRVTVKAEQSYAELFIDTAVRALALHERDLGITKAQLDDRQRREMITARYRAALEQTKEETIENVVEAFANGEVDIRPSSVEGVFEIKFISTVGIPDNMEGLMNTIDIIIPAHLDVFYTYLYNTWGDLSVKTWGELASYTWNEVYSEDVI